MRQKLFKKQSNLLSEIINDTYKFLTNNGIEVKTNINIIKHKSIRSDFVDFFINKFNKYKYTYCYNKEINNIINK